MSVLEGKADFNEKTEEPDTSLDTSRLRTYASIEFPGPIR